MLLGQKFSLASYLRESHQWRHLGDEPLVKTIHQVADDHEKVADRVTKMLADRVGQVPHGHFPMEFTEHDEAALDYLVPELIRHEQQMVERTEQLLGNLGPEPEVRELVESVLKTDKGHVQTLTEVQQTLKDAK